MVFKEFLSVVLPDMRNHDPEYFIGHTGKLLGLRPEILYV